MLRRQCDRSKLAPSDTYENTTHGFFITPTLCAKPGERSNKVQLTIPRGHDYLATDGIDLFLNLKLFLDSQSLETAQQHKMTVHLAQHSPFHTRQ